MAELLHGSAGNRTPSPERSSGRRGQQDTDSARITADVFLWTAARARRRVCYAPSNANLLDQLKGKLLSLTMGGPR
jgi:hypothetical protein